MCTNNQDLEKFAESAKRFCLLMELSPSNRPTDFYKIVRDTLKSLNDNISNVEAISGDKNYDQYNLSDTDYFLILENIGKLLDPELANIINDYTGKNDFELTDEFFGFTMLSDDLADIYRDLKKGLNRYEIQTEDAKTDAGFCWRFNYEYHWFDHLKQAYKKMGKILEFKQLRR